MEVKLILFWGRIEPEGAIRREASGDAWWESTHVPGVWLWRFDDSKCHTSARGRADLLEMP
jgi:hypothetical protein